jgi:hypothetical protein
LSLSHKARGFRPAQQNDPTAETSPKQAPENGTNNWAADEMGLPVFHGDGLGAAIDEWRSQTQKANEGRLNLGAIAYDVSRSRTYGAGDFARFVEATGLQTSAVHSYARVYGRLKSLQISTRAEILGRLRAGSTSFSVLRAAVVLDDDDEFYRVVIDASSSRRAEALARPLQHKNGSAVSPTRRSGGHDTETAEATGMPHADRGSDRAATADPARALGVRSNPDARKKCVEPASVAAPTRSRRRHADPPGKDKAQARTLVVGVGDDAALAEATSYLAALAREAWLSGRTAHLLVYCSTDPESRAALVEALPFAPQEEEDPFTENYSKNGDDEGSAKERKQKRLQSRMLRAWKRAEFARLSQIISDQGGIAPTGDLKEEYQGIPKALKNKKNGRSGDDMAQFLATNHPEFGIKDERSLIDVLSGGL